MPIYEFTSEKINPLTQTTFGQMEIAGLSEFDLLNLNADTLKELRRRGTVRSSNNPVGDYAETLFCRAFGWEQAPNSEKDADAIGGDGVRYQIKGRRYTQPSGFRQLGALRRLPEKNFDILAGVLFNENFSVLRAALVPHALVAERALYVRSTNSWRFMLMDNIWDCDGVVDVTSEIADSAGYPVQIREQSLKMVHKSRGYRSGGLDYTRYDLVLGDRQISDLGKGRAILEAFAHLVDNGVAPEDIASRCRRSAERTFMSVEGEFEPDDFTRLATNARARQGRRFDPIRYFCGGDDLVYFDGRTYAFSNQWGGDDWLQTMNSLRDAFPDQKIAFSPSDQ